MTSEVRLKERSDCHYLALGGLVCLMCAVANAAFADQVEEGCLLDPALTNVENLAFWVDANKNCIVDESGAVVQWADVREDFGAGQPTADHVFAFKRMIVGGEEKPTYKTDERYPGKKFLSFGNYGDDKWMYLADASGSLIRQTVGSFFCVIGFEKKSNCGHLLGNRSGDDVFFHKGGGSYDYGPIASEGANCMWKGETRKNGVRINPRTVDYTYDDFQILSQVGPYQAVNEAGQTVRPFFSTLLNDRDLPHKVGTETVGLRYGGAVIGELLVWDKVLTEAERRQVEAYLKEKWFSSPTLGRVEILRGEEFIEDAGDRDVTVDSVVGDGVFVKKGSGCLVLDRAACGEAANFRFESGSARVDGGLRSWLWISPLTGTRLELGLGSVAVSVAASSKTVEINGGWLRVDPASLADKKVFVTSSRLTIQPKSAAAFAEDDRSLEERYPNLLSCGSFEESDDQSVWTLDSAAHRDVYGTPWYSCKNNSGTVVTTNTIPDGTYYLAIQGVGETLGWASQTFDAPFDGLYRLSYYMTRRTNRSETEGDTRVQMSLDGTVFYRYPVSADWRADRNEFKRYSVILPPLTKGSHVLKVAVDDNATKDRAVLLDDVRIFPVAAGEFVNIVNSGFDSALTKVSANGANGYFYGGDFGSSESTPDVSIGWTRAGEGNAGLSQNSSYWNWLNSDEDTANPTVDYRKAYLQNDASISTSVHVSRAGRMLLSLKYANRSHYTFPNIDGDARGTGHKIRVSLDNVVIAEASPVTAYGRVCLGTTEVTAGDHVLTIANVRPDGSTKDLTSVVDEVRLWFDDSTPRIVGEAGFVDYALWTPGDPVLSGANRNLETGRADLWIARGGSLSQSSITIPSNGFYQVSLKASGQALELNTVAGVYNNYAHYPVTVEVRVDGVSQGIVTLQDDQVRRFALPLPYLTAGSHSIGLYCLTDGTAESGRAEIKDLDVVPMPVAAIVDDSLMSGAVLKIGTGGMLDLQYEGTLRVASFSAAGKSYSGIVDAQTCGGSVSGPGKIFSEGRGLIIVVK